MIDQIRLLFLGTGAAIPSLRRGLPTLALLFDGEIILCDCSEGTQMRLQQAGVSTSRVKHVFISHLHGDHIFGLPGLITSQHLLKRTEPLYIYGPPELEKFIRTIQTVTQHHLSYPVIIEKWAPEEEWSRQLDGFSVQALPLQHSQPCHGFRFKENDRRGKFDTARAMALSMPDSELRAALIKGQTVQVNGKTITPEQVIGPCRRGRVLAYCTDTRPCANALCLAKDADVLVYESTFHPDQQQLAYETGHSTCTDAAQVAKRAGCKKLYLYHVSGRQDDKNETDMVGQAQAVFPATKLPDDFYSCSVPRPEEP